MSSSDEQSSSEDDFEVEVIRNNPIADAAQLMK